MADVGELLRNYQAQQELERQGSIMARPEKPQWRKDSPLLDSILGALDQLLSVANPLENIGGPSGAVLGPIGRTASKAVNQAQKHVAKAIFRADPSQLQAVVEDPRMLRLSTPTKPGLQAMLKSGDYPGEALATYRGSSTMPLGTMTVPPTTLRGLDPSGLRDTLANVPQAALHETQHFLNQPRIYTTETALGKVHPQSGALFDLLSPYLSGGAKQAARQGALRNMNPAIAVDEALAYLSGMGTRNPQTEDVGKLLYEKLKNLPGQARQPLSVERVGGAIEAAKQESPLEQGLIDYIQSAFKRATAGFSPPMENLY